MATGSKERQLPERHIEYHPHRDQIRVAVPVRWLTVLVLASAAAAASTYLALTTGFGFTESVAFTATLIDEMGLPRALAMVAVVRVVTVATGAALGAAVLQPLSQRGLVPRRSTGVFVAGVYGLSAGYYAWLAIHNLELIL